MRKTIAWSIAAVIVVALALILFLARIGQCSGAFPYARDSDQVTQAESKELMGEAQQIYEKYQHVPYQVLPPPTQPIIARISGNMATLTVAGPMDQGQLLYAQAWQIIYDQHHFHFLGPTCVKMRLIWKSGSTDQEFPVNDL
jgi:hypothetical protein